MLKPWHTVLLIAACSIPVAHSDPPARHDGQRDFDFQLGSWRTHISRLVKPLTGSKTWAEYDGTTVVRPIWSGRAQLAEVEVDGPSGHIEGLSLRLYNPAAQQWSMTFVNASAGVLTQPAVGEFRNGRGELYDQEPINGKMILVRGVWTDITPKSARFEQAFSEDGGKTWEVNWIGVDTRM